MIEIQARHGGLVLPVKARAGARKNELRGTHEGALKVAVTQVAEKGKANQAIVALLAGKLGLRKSQLELLSGATTSRKEFLVRDIPLAELRRRLEEACAGDGT